MPANRLACSTSDIEIPMTGRPLVALTSLLLASAGCAALGSGAVPPGTDFVQRRDWGASPPASPMREHAPTRITIHHTATPQNPARPLDDKMRALQRFSQSESLLASGRTKPVWGDIPYHFYIDPAGRVAEGRPLAYAGDSNTAYDPAGHVLIVLEGNFEEENPTRAQLDSLARLTWWHARRWSVRPGQIGVHRDFADTLCPGRNLEYYLPWLEGYVHPDSRSRPRGE
jgi:hypothetical protein